MNSGKLIDSIVADKAYLQGLRRDIHAHPELAFEENRTAELVVSVLTEAGLEVTSGIGRTGVVGTLTNGNSKHSIGLRADMDALAMNEANDFSYKSKAAGKFHGCGHDGHTVMLLGAARHLARNRCFDGTVHFIFQPAEEGAGGASAMIEDGLFTRFPMKQVFGMHNFPPLEVGAFALRTGAFFAAYQPFDIVIRGTGGHAAMPHTCIDPVPVAAQIIQNIQTIVSRSIDPQSDAVISLTMLQAGDAYNVIPERVKLGGSMRYFEQDTGQAIRERLVDIVKDVAKANGASAEVEFDTIYYPPLRNTHDESAIARNAAEILVGAKNVDSSFMKMMGSDDFAHMLNEIPGCYILMGNGSDNGYGSCMVHNPEYDFNDEALTTGASFWVKLVETALPVTRTKN